MRAVHAARPYWFEVFTVANLIAIALALRPRGISILPTMPGSFASIGMAFAAQLALGVAVRFALSGRAYLRSIRTAQWITDTLRIAIFSVLWVHAYGWIKLTIPLLHGRLFDQQLWNLDRALFFGMSPNILFLNLFSPPYALGAIDWLYANVFLASLFVGAAFFLSAPERPLRVGFTNANSTMWLIAAWLYVAIPSLGPAYYFPDVWQPLAASLGETQWMQRMLMTNYQIVLHYATRPRPVNLLYGIAAFPSLHVGFEMLTFLWIRRVSRVGKIAFGIALAFIFIGSIVTGWHYLIDALAGVALAVLCWAAFQRPLPRFRRHATTE